MTRPRQTQGSPLVRFPGVPYSGDTGVACGVTLRLVENALHRHDHTPYHRLGDSSLVQRHEWTASIPPDQGKCLQAYKFYSSKYSRRFCHYQMYDTRGFDLFFGTPFTSAEHLKQSSK
jgi:hypothetical protein